MINTSYGINSDYTKTTAGTRSDEQKLKDTCQDFEAIFMHKMMQAMRSVNETMDSGLIKKSQGEKIFSDMLDQEFSVIASRTSVNGLGDMMFEQLKKGLNDPQAATMSLGEAQAQLLRSKNEITTQVGTVPGFVSTDK